ncbi:MAG: hypothetical protein ACTSV2_12540 [Candidatus Thorarchaeota archaeon]
MDYYFLIIGLILIILAMSMRFRKVDFLIDRFSFFQKVIRKGNFEVDREALSKYYSVLFSVPGVILLIGTVLLYIYPSIYDTLSPILWITLISIAILGILYANVSKRFLVYEIGQT